ncbi:uncharacterized protein LOC116435199 [Nomia melanderi]|uniref:uncharacterized protein LOC116435199 n=1 Tax=Nomia melanderi TaxID=2448451 RepID=UPI0013046457|nr:uncharacterized protein LOC116435199 [Nomia melanderi]
MPLRSEASSSSRDTLNTVSTADERGRTGRYLAGGAALAITLLALHHALLRDTSTIAGVCIPAIIMVSYIIWILYSAHRDRRKASRSATTVQLTEVISAPPRTQDRTCRNVASTDELRKGCPKLTNEDSRGSRENPAFSVKDEAV